MMRGVVGQLNSCMTKTEYLRYCGELRPPSAIHIRSSSSNAGAMLAKSTAVKYDPDR